VGQVDKVLEHVDGAMIGRQAYHRPYFLAELEHHFNAGWDMPSRADVVEAMLPYIEGEQAAGVPFNSISRHMLGRVATSASMRIARVLEAKCW
jgi:tRNA-dihydrouridine synthase A